MRDRNPVDLMDSVAAMDLLEWVHEWLVPGDSIEERDKLSEIYKVFHAHKWALRNKIDGSHSKEDSDIAPEAKKELTPPVKKRKIKKLKRRSRKK